MVENNPFLELSEQIADVRNLVMQLHKQQAPVLNNDTDEIFGINEASVFLGIKKQTLYLMTSKKLIPFSKPQKKLYFSKKSLMEWLSKQTTKSVSQIENEAKNYKKGGANEK